MKGCHRIKLTCADRKSLVKSKQVTCSEGHILKVLNEGDKVLLAHSQYTLNEIIATVDYEDWNAFLRANPVPEGLPNFKPNKRLTDAIEKRIKELDDEDNPLTP